MNILGKDEDPSELFWVSPGYKMVRYGNIIPICSMYGVVTNIWPQNHPNVGKYTSTMEHLGLIYIYILIGYNLYGRFDPWPSRTRAGCRFTATRGTEVFGEFPSGGGEFLGPDIVYPEFMFFLLVPI